MLSAVSSATLPIVRLSQLTFYLQCAILPLFDCVLFLNPKLNKLFLKRIYNIWIVDFVVVVLLLLLLWIQSTDRMKSFIYFHGFVRAKNYLIQSQTNGIAFCFLVSSFMFWLPRKTRGHVEKKCAQPTSATATTYPVSFLSCSSSFRWNEEKDATN